MAQLTITTRRSTAPNGMGPAIRMATTTTTTITFMATPPTTMTVGQAPRGRPRLDINMT